MNGILSRIRYGAVLAIAMSSAAFVYTSNDAMAQSYRSMSCDGLWYARNAIYAEKGYCFQTRRAIRTFGEGCFPPYGRLNRAEQREVQEIQMWERRKGCR